ncbi:hypothetical protein NLJ89_g3763 [Agrocybe chaxingu]|uniref:NAD-dependent epimerase/dehydratase domain-containing protein n=1 Tax=Agrocybe chaxingu TaxID=84603 RepID=A0A9W8K9J0_9AGAR|nr:hypothetical protein NLJ89_g3763 [Agrocybe chaxingu]
MEPTESKLVLITGGHGFLGTHLARRLQTAGVYRIRIVDIAHNLSNDEPIGHEFIRGDLTELTVCRAAVRDVDIVFHFAANMGGMGTIHDENDFILYPQNHSMTVNLLQACLNAKVKRFIYASSACVYPDVLQTNISSDTSLHEDDVWANTPPKPQGLYGLEKLISEILLAQLASKMDIRVVRFHNVFGPGGAWNDGREKAPAAMIRKAIALQLLGDKGVATFELLDSRSPVHQVFNIGSDSAVSVQDLAEIALTQVGLDPSAVSFSYHQSKPVGVASRNSNNERSSSLLDWRPTISLEDGMCRTEAWIRSEIVKSLQVAGDSRTILLRQMLESKILHLQPRDIVFAILLPITSRGGGDPNVCLHNLRNFATSLFRTTWRDVHSTSGVRYRVVVYIATDHDDDFLLERTNGYTRAEVVLHDEGLHDLVTITCNHPHGHVCKIWKDCARKAFIDGCDYMVLMGDDVELRDEGWMREAQEHFQNLASERGLPIGFGCVAFTDISFPGMPTFPIIHRTHMDIFKGEVIPDSFINQDGDPFLFQLYRRWNSSRMFSFRLSNGIGGAGEA